MTEETTPDEKQKGPTLEQLHAVVRRLRVCQLPGLRIMGLVPKGQEDKETTKLEDVMGISVKMTPMGAMPVIVSMDFCALAVPTYRVRTLSGEYWVKELGEEEAMIYARVYLDAIADLIRQKNAPDDPNMVMPADPRAMEMLAKMAAGGQLPPGMGGPGGIVPGR